MKVYSLMVAYSDPDDNVYLEHSGRVFVTMERAQTEADLLCANAPEWFTFRRDVCGEIDFPYATVKPIELED